MSRTKTIRESHGKFCGVAFVKIPGLGAARCLKQPSHRGPHSGFTQVRDGRKMLYVVVHWGELESR